MSPTETDMVTEGSADAPSTIPEMVSEEKGAPSPHIGENTKDVDGIGALRPFPEP